MMGCEARSEFKIGPTDDADAVEFMALEESSCCMRKCCGNIRPWTMNLHHKTNHGEKFVEFRRPYNWLPSPGKCCCYQTMTAHGTKGKQFGKFQESCWFCIPSFKIFDEELKHVYDIHRPTCCGGTCVNCCAGGCCSTKTPFHIFNLEGGDHVGVINKLWGGSGREFFSDGDTFMVEFPDDATPELKTTLVGATMMINQLYFEGHKAKGGGGAPAVTELV